MGNWVFQRFLTLISLVLLTKQQSESWNVSLFRISTVWLVVIFSHQIAWKLCSCLDLLSYKSGTGCECKGLWIFIKEGDHQLIIGYQIIGKKFVKTWCHNWIFSILPLDLMNIKLYLKFRNTGPLPVFLCWHFVNTTITRMELFSEELSTHSIHLFVSVLLQPLLLTPTFRLVLVYPSTVYNSLWIFHAKFNRNNCSIVPPLNPFSPSLCVCEWVYIHYSVTTGGRDNSRWVVWLWWIIEQWQQTHPVCHLHHDHDVCLLGLSLYRLACN